MSDDSDNSLVERAVCGDRDAFASLVERYYLTIYRVAYKWCGNQDDAEDIAQEVCIKLGKSIRGFKRESQFSSWLYRIIINAVHDFQSVRARHHNKVVEMAHAANDETVCHQEMDGVKVDLWRAIQHLPEKQREVVLLVFGEDLNHVEAAEILGCAESTVSWHIHDAKKRLKVFLYG
jgi:RNA polymerase sigma-70 factor (ECF subfamily)